jgi:hypothetical protein
MMLQTMKMPQVYKTPQRDWIFTGADFFLFYSTGSQKAGSVDNSKRF